MSPRSLPPNGLSKVANSRNVVDGAVESVARRMMSSSAPQNTTAQGLRWLVLSLSVALVANLALLGALLYERGQGLDVGLTTIVFLSWEVLLAAGAVLAFLAFRGLREGLLDVEPAQATARKESAVAFVGAAASGSAYLATGLILGFVYVPTEAYIAASGGSAPWVAWLGVGIRATHALAPLLMAVLLGVFLIASVWHLSMRAGRVLASAAFAVGLLAAFLAFFSPFVSLPPLLPADPLLVGIAASGSLALWLTVGLMARMRLRGTSAASDRDAAPT